MIKNRLLKLFTGVLTVGALIIILCVKLWGDSGLCEMIYDIALAVFGSAVLAWLVAMVEQHQDKKVIRRTVVKNVLEAQREIKKIMSEYNKVLDKWEAQDFRTSANKLYGYIDEFYAYNNTLKLENGKYENYFETEILEIYKGFMYVASDFRTIEKHLDNNQRDDAYSKYKDCVEASNLIVNSIIKVLSKEYGNKFASIEEIGLL